jgi:hypothetical protein
MSRTRDFLEKGGVSKEIIRKREAQMLEQRGKFLSGQAGAAGKSGDHDRQLDRLKELQQLQLGVAGSDPNRQRAEGALGAAQATQQQIEQVYKAQQKAAQGNIANFDAAKVSAQGLADEVDRLIKQSGRVNPLADGAVDTLNGMINEVQRLLALINAAGGKTKGVTPPPPVKRARGGPVPGQGSGDKVPAMLEPGEFVIRKSVVNKMGAGFMERLNAQKFASGGSVPGLSAHQIEVRDRWKRGNGLNMGGNWRPESNISDRQRTIKGMWKTWRSGLGWKPESNISERQRKLKERWKNGRPGGGFFPSPWKPESNISDRQRRVKLMWDAGFRDGKTKRKKKIAAGRRKRLAAAEKRKAFLKNRGSGKKSHFRQMKERADRRRAQNKQMKMQKQGGGFDPFGDLQNVAPGGSTGGKTGGGGGGGGYGGGGTGPRGNPIMNPLRGAGSGVLDSSLGFHGSGASIDMNLVGRIPKSVQAANDRQFAAQSANLLRGKFAITPGGHDLRDPGNLAYERRSNLNRFGGGILGVGGQRTFGNTTLVQDRTRAKEQYLRNTRMQAEQQRSSQFNAKFRRSRGSMKGYRRGGMVRGAAGQRTPSTLGVSTVASSDAVDYDPARRAVSNIPAGGVFPSANNIGGGGQIHNTFHIGSPNLSGIGSYETYMESMSRMKHHNAIRVG